MKKKKLLFVTYGGGHVNALSPVIKTFINNPDFKVHVLGLTTAQTVLEREGIPYLGFKDFVEKGDEPALEKGKELAGDLQNNAVPLEETIAYLGLSYRDLEIRLGAEEAERLYKEKGRQAFLPLTVLKRIISKIKPDLVVATSAPRAEQAAMLTARELSIPAVCIVDLFGLMEIKWLKEPGYANKICVLSDHVRGFIIRAGRRQEEVVVTGNPAFDRLAQPDLDLKGQQLRQEKGWCNDRVILWASQSEPKLHPVTGERGDPDLPRKIDQVFFDIIERHPDWRLVIRYHPSETVPSQPLPPRVETSPLSDDLSPLLKAVDIIVSMTSTVGLEGALIGTSFITLDVSVYTPDAPFSKMGIAKGVGSLDHLEDALEEVLAEKWLPAQALPVIGQSTANIANIIMDLISN